MAEHVWRGSEEAPPEYLELQHQLLKLVLGRNYLAPLQEPHTILDVGCGQGLWMREMAQEFPNATITGFDIDQRLYGAALTRLPPGEPTPPNVRFIQADALQRFRFADAEFDFTHLRLVSGDIPPDRWRDVLGEMVRVTCAGGTVEVVDVLDMPRSQSPAFSALLEASKRLMMAMRKPIGVAPELATLMRQAGLTAVHAQELLIGQSPAEQDLLRMTALATVQATEPAVVHFGIRPAEQFRALFDQARDELSQGSAIMWPLIGVYGERPSFASEENRGQA